MAIAFSLLWATHTRIVEPWPRNSKRQNSGPELETKTGAHLPDEPIFTCNTTLDRLKRRCHQSESSSMEKSCDLSICIHSYTDTQIASEPRIYQPEAEHVTTSSEAILLPFVVYDSVSAELQDMRILELLGACWRSSSILCTSMMMIQNLPHLRKLPFPYTFRIGCFGGRKPHSMLL